MNNTDHTNYQKEIETLKQEIKFLKSSNKQTVADFEKQENFVEETRIDNIRFQTIFDQSAVGNKIIDSDLRILQVNEALLALLGYTRKELLGALIVDFSHPDCKENWMLLQKKLWLGKLPSFNMDACLIKKDGNPIWCNITSIIFEDNGTTLGFTIVQDISERKAFDKVRQQADARKDEFISVMSHEIKTPLGNIKSYIQLLEREISKEEKVYPFIQKTGKHIKRLERLISDLLDITKMNSGKSDLYLTWFPFHDILRETINSVQELSPTHKIVLEDNVKVLYRGDQYRIEQVIINFLNNAIKYSPGAGKVIVRTKTELDNIIVSVQDFGIGIAKNDMAQLFDRFYRVEKVAMQYQGMGLGLFIASQILLQHNGSFWVESEVGKGSTFFFRLPIEKVKTKKVTDTKIHYKDDSVSVKYLKDHQRVQVEWTGFQNHNSIKAGCLKALKIVKENKCNKMLIDNTHVLGSWADAAEWVGMDWFPMIEEAGLEYLAWIHSASTFDQLSLRETVNAKVGNVETQLFRNVEDASLWLADVD
ncbi:PAS domain-containing sensor histidine kinase [Desertivirga xinjiangensis]|uniref:PAS domain-containing sensor histidine kinase n=1 Tax=Desertivirga xinjiangensis TaxID=539206 RepID=UPI00210F0F27|nr:ATP-binding protein [Pedobacter xinjiangensis]